MISNSRNNERKKKRGCCIVLEYDPSQESGGRKVKGRGKKRYQCKVDFNKLKKNNGRNRNSQTIEYIEGSKVGRRMNFSKRMNKKLSFFDRRRNFLYDKRFTLFKRRGTQVTELKLNLIQMKFLVNKSLKKGFRPFDIRERRYVAKGRLRRVREVVMKREISPNPIPQIV